MSTYSCIFYLQLGMYIFFLKPSFRKGIKAISLLSYFLYELSTVWQYFINMKEASVTQLSLTSFLSGKVIIESTQDKNTNMTCAFPHSGKQISIDLEIHFI